MESNAKKDTDNVYVYDIYHSLKNAVPYVEKNHRTLECFTTVTPPDALLPTDISNGDGRNCLGDLGTQLVQILRTQLGLLYPIKK